MKASLILLIAAIFLHATGSKADEPVRITRGGEPRGSEDFCIQITGELRAFTGYLHGSAPFTLQQAIDAAGGVGEWSGEILIYAPAANANTDRKLEKRLSVNKYLHDPEVQNLPLTNGCLVRLPTLGPRFK